MCGKSLSQRPTDQSVLQAEPLASGAVGLVNEMMRVSRGLGTLPSTGQIATLVRDHAWLNFWNLLQFIICPLVEDSSATAERRRQAVDMVIYGLQTIAEITKGAIDSRDGAMFAEVNRTWGHIHEFWLDVQVAEYLPESLDKDLAVRIRDKRDQLRAVWIHEEAVDQPTRDCELQLVAMLER